MKALLSLMLISVVGLGWATKRALIVAIDGYGEKSGLSRLVGAEGDADGLESTLKLAGFTDVVTLKGSQAIASRILVEIEKLASRTQRDDLVVFYFSGHGFQPDSNVFLIPFGAENESDAVLRHSSIAAGEVARLLSTIPADLLLCGFDMCRNDPRAAPAGEPGKGVGGQGTKSVPSAINSFSGVMRDSLEVRVSDSGPKRVLTMFASSPGQRSWEDVEGRRGFFSLYLEKGLQGEAARDNGEVTVSSLTEYLEAKVFAAVQEAKRQEQRPDILMLGPGVSSFVLAKSQPTVRPVHLSFYEKALDLLGGKRKQDVSRSDAMKALGWLELAIEAGQNLFGAYAWMAWTLDGVLQEYDEAERMYRKAIELDPKNSVAHINLGLLLKDVRKKYGEAERMYRKAIELDPKNSSAYNNLGLLLKVVGKDYDEAERMYRKAIELDPKNSSAYNNLGVHQEEFRKNNDEAERMYRKAIELDPKNSIAHYNLGLLLKVVRKNYDEAERMYHRAIELDPKDLFAYNALGLLLETVRKDYEEAERMYRKAIELGPLQPVFYRNLGLMLKDQGRTADLQRLREQAKANGVPVDF